MSEVNPHNPFDKTIWDPKDPEQAIEDPFHGPEAVRSLLATPPMKRVDGTYWVFGASYICGTSTFDAEGKPFIKFSTMPGTFDAIRESFSLSEWTRAFHDGELPPREEMGYPEFRYDLRPYFVVDKPEEKKEF